MQTSVWLSMVTFVAGWLLSTTTEMIRHRWTLERDREARKASRRDQILERRDAFQRQTLLELQDALMDVARTATELRLDDVRRYRATGQWQGQHFYPKELSTNAGKAMRRSALLNSRVRNQETRDLVSKFRVLAAKVAPCQSPEDSEEMFKGMSFAFQDAQDRIGKELRSLDDLEDEAENSSGLEGKRT